MPTDPRIAVDKSHAERGLGVAHEPLVPGVSKARHAHTSAINGYNLGLGMFAQRPEPCHDVKQYFPAEPESSAERGRRLHKTTDVHHTSCNV